MNVQRFLAPSSREAMNKVKMGLGDAAIILSTRTTEHGFEVLATTEEGLSSLPINPSRPPRQAQAPEGKSRLQERAAQQVAPRKVPSDSTVAQDTETLAMSTLSFQDYVRERMLRKRRELLQGSAAPEDGANARPQTEAPPPAAGLLHKDDDMRLSFPQADDGRRPAARTKANAPAKATADAPKPSATEMRLNAELTGLKTMIEDRFNTLTWLGSSRQDPIQSGLMLKLIRAGYSPTMVRAVLERLPADRKPADAFRWTQEVLARNLRTQQDASALCDEGGVFALVGSTGVGKTTTAAKLAAQCVKVYGANSVGLITLDTYRVSGYEQLRTYGRMLGVVAHLAHDLAALQDLLGLLANKRMVIIDTAGLGQKDPRIQEMLELLATPKIKKLLVLNAGSHGDTLDDVFAAYKGTELYGVVLSKLDEAAKLGPALDTLIRHQVVLRGVCTGQRVPEDWLRPDAQTLVRMSMATSGKSAFDPRDAELGIFFAQTGQPPVSLDAWNA